jgi:carotenoid cleavage dioxygenase-like enzyme
MFTRRHLLQMAGCSGTALLSARLLSGCGTADPSAPTSIDWTPDATPPVLGGDPARAWWLRGNYAPVSDEIETFALSVQGAIPPELNGVFMRVGANPLSGKSSHWFMGDGMLHGVRLENGQAQWYRNRWIRTAAFDDPSAGGLIANMANTALVQHAGKLLALYEVTLPTEIQSDLSTTGEYSFGGALSGPMTAHPKIDPVTGEMHFIGYGPFPPYLTYHVADKSGVLMRSEAITVPQPTMMHDFQLTANHAVFMDLPIVFDLNEIASGFPFKWDPNAGARIGLLPLGGTNEDVTWFEVEPCYVFHTFNAYEDAAGSVVLEGCRLPSIWVDGPNDFGSASTPWRWTLNPKTGDVSEEAFHDFNVDFPIIDRRVQGREHRVDYGLKLTPGTEDYPTHPTGIVKVDRQSGTTDYWSPGEAVQPDEALFVPANGQSGEDDGWLLSMVYDRAEARSEVAIIDASNVSAGPVARIAMPRRVPFGFHGTWVADPSP